MGIFSSKLAVKKLCMIFSDRILEVSSLIFSVQSGLFLLTCIGFSNQRLIVGQTSIAERALSSNHSGYELLMKKFQVQNLMSLERRKLVMDL